MGIYLTKDKGGEYRRAWYGRLREGGKLTGHKLATPVRGKIPLDAEGRFSLALQGDAAFEKSKAEALEELQNLLAKSKDMKAEERNEPGYLEREVYRKLKGRTFEVVAIEDLAETNARRTRYALTGNRHKDGGRRKVYDCLKMFSEWCAKLPAEEAKKLKTLADIDRATVSAYYAHLAADHSWGSLQKHFHSLSSVFRYFMPNSENPFQKVYEDEYKGRVKQSDGDFFDKTEVTHEAPSPEQMQKIWQCAEDDTLHPFLYRLAVIAACTGLRIGDCCRLTWDKVDMLNYRLSTKTAKTGKLMSVPIFDYNPEAEDYHPIFGELRRELEAALAERQDGEKFVVPEAAKIYNGRNPDLITKLGKKLFARALFSDATEPEIRQVDSEGKEIHQRPVDILASIDSATMLPTKKARLKQTYELLIEGKSYSQIAAETGGRKSTVSQDLAEIERITETKIRPGLPTDNGKPTIRKMIRRTQLARQQGTRSACLYGWHSMRVFFVVTAINAGIDPNDLRLITAHSTVAMVLHYFNPEEAAAAEKMRRQLRRKPLPPALPPPDSVEGRLSELKRLSDKGLISNEDFRTRKAEILSEI